MSLIVSTATVVAQTGTVDAGFSAGFSYPFVHIDALAGIVAAGAIAGWLGRRAALAVLTAFVLFLAIGLFIGMESGPARAVEIFAAVAAVALGLRLASRRRPPAWAACVVVAVFAGGLGYGHGLAFRRANAPELYHEGMVLAAGGLYLAGMVFGRTSSAEKGTGLRVLGGLVAAASAYGLYLAISGRS